MHKTTLNDGDKIIFGLSSRVYVCKIDFSKVEKILAKKEEELKANITQLGQVDNISGIMSN